MLGACQTVPTTWVTDLDALEALALLKDEKAVIIDVRSSAEKRSGRLQGALEIQFGKDDFLARPVSAEARENFANEVRAANIGNKRVLLLCQYGVRSREAQKALAEHGIIAESIPGGWLGKGRLVGLKDWL